MHRASDTTAPLLERHVTARTDEQLLQLLGCQVKLKLQFFESHVHPYVQEERLGPLAVPLEHLLAEMHQPQPLTVVHVEHEGEDEQRSGQSCRLQVWLAAGLASVHSASDTSALLLERHTTLRVCTPAPHVAEQLDHSLEVQVNFSGQSCVLQGTFVSGRTLVHISSGTTTLPTLDMQVRLRSCRPPPHVTGHGVQPLTICHQ